MNREEDKKVAAFSTCRTVNRAVGCDGERANGGLVRGDHIDRGVAKVAHIDADLPDDGMVIVQGALRQYGANQ